MKFKTLTTNEGLSNNSVNDIISNTDGVLWIATWDGLNLYDGHNFIVFKHNQADSTSIAGNVVTRLVKDNSDVMWLLTDNKSVSRYLGDGRFKNYSFNKQPREFRQSKNGELIVEINDDEAYHFKDEQFVKKENRGFYRNNKSRLNNILLSKFPNLSINESMRDYDGNIWYATQNNGLFIIRKTGDNIHNENIEHYEYDLYSKYSFTSNEIEKIYQDDFGNVWLGHKDGGLSMAYRGSEKIGVITPHPVKYPNLPYETVRAITKDLNNNIWLGYYTQGLFNYDPATKSYLRHDLSELSGNEDWNRLRSLYTSSDGSVWAGTYGGVVRVKNGKKTFFNAADVENFPNNRNYSMFEDDKKQLWIACWGGLAKFDLEMEEFITFNGQAKLADLNIRKVFIYEDEAILSIEEGGVIILNTITGDISDINKDDGILSNNAYSTFKDGKTGYYWIASSEGISVYDKEQGLINNITEYNGLQSHLVYSLTLYNDKVWVSTTKGIAAVDRNNYSVSSLNSDEGWQAAEFSEGGYYQDLSGYLYFGGINGVNYFSPTTIEFEKELPRLIVSVDDKENFKGDIIKEYSDNQLKFEITSVSYTKNTDNKILYKLSGFDSNWHVFDESPVYYSYLPYGHYNLAIKNSLDTNDEFAKTFNIIVNKPFYLTGWFISLFLVALFTGLTYLYFLRNKSVVRNRKILEQRILGRTKIINDQKQNLEEINRKLDKKNKEIGKQKEELLNLYQQLKNEDFEIDKFKAFVLSEFKEPINKIIATADELENQSPIKKNISTHSGELLNLLMEWDYLGHIKEVGANNKSIINLKSTIRPLIENLKVQSSKTKLHLDYTLDLSDSLVEMDVLRFKLLFKYLFNVIVKYALVNSSLKVVLENSNGMFLMNISSESKIFKDNFFNIEHYSPYFRAVNTLVTAMNGQLNINHNKALSLVLQLPIKLIETKGNEIEHVSWKHIGLNEKLPSNKNNILVFCEKNDFIPAKQLLEHPDNTLLFENVIEEALSAIKHVNLHGLVVYNTSINESLVTLCNAIKNDGSQTTLPLIYISEEIDYFLREHTIELGVDTFIQLPASRVFIQKKFSKLITGRREFLKDRSKQLLYNSSFSNDDKLLSSNEKSIKKAISIIHKNIGDHSFNVDKLAKMLFVSKIKGYRMFKEVLGQSPLDVIIDLRLQKAQYLLKNKTLNIAEVSRECGFNDPKYFSRLFKKNIGCSPKQFRKSLADA
ncbi:helix-turn-helix domain-containing protein [Maribacter sp.]|uniref:helix-turn-helix domain-containing protein n=1 Tax=Maribacter sp. TaxID=1897614 RepID=UPI003296C5FB